MGNNIRMLGNHSRTLFFFVRNIIDFIIFI
jgi:hypothetical protein